MIFLFLEYLNRTVRSLSRLLKSDKGMIDQFGCISAMIRIEYDTHRKRKMGIFAVELEKP